jgi:hypothetical protein
MIEFYKEGQARDLSFIEQTPMWPVVTYGIVNPYGPTLMGFGIIVHEEEDYPELSHYSLNPFQQNVTALGIFNTADNLAESVNGALKHFDLFAGGTPTLVLPSRFLADADFSSFYNILLSQVDDLIGTIDLCRRFIGNPWDRVSEETKGAAESLLGGDTDKVSAAHTASDVDEFLEIVQPEQHFMEELKAFAYAWKGSIDFQRSSGSGALAEAALSHTRFISIIGNILEGGPSSS